MYRFLLFFSLFLYVSSAPLQAQQPKKPTASEIYEGIKKLNFLGSVLYIAAHPDDENTKLITYLSNHVKARTSYLSLTRGDGGQNLIGPELRDLLGVIRTNELLEARKTDGGEQWFTRAVDFGFSKHPDETFSIWNKDEVLSDVVRTIRKLKPDVIINRFDHRTPGKSHGHHTASAMLSVEAFDLASDPKAYPEQLDNYGTWQPKSLYFNTSWFFYGSPEKFEEADKSDLLAVPTGVYYPSFGLSNGEIAAASRSKHQSQGFGNTGTRGEETEYLEHLKGTPPKSQSLFEGIDTSWSRIEGGDAIGEILEVVESDFDFKNPAASVPKLLEAYELLRKREDYWGIQKTKEIKAVIAACSGLFLEAISETQNIARSGKLSLRLEAINRSDVAVHLEKIRVGNKVLFNEAKPLENNQPLQLEHEITLPDSLPYSSPYWLRKPGTIGLHHIENPEHIGLPTVENSFPVHFTLSVNGVKLSLQRDIVYKFNDPVQGEVYQPFQVLPEVTVSPKDPVRIFPDNTSQQLPITVRAGKDNVSGTVSLQHPDGWKTDLPKDFSLAKKGQDTTLLFTITPPEIPGEGKIRVLAQAGDRYFTEDRVTINYPHIPFQHVLVPAETKVARIALKKSGNRIGYIPGAGDAIPEALAQMGYEVTTIEPSTISASVLDGLDAVVVGIRAYNVQKELAYKQPLLLEYVENGGTLLVQYNVSRGLVTKDIGPYPLSFSRDRVTDETSQVKLLQADHPALQHPNPITANDFENWVQERGLYFPETWDNNYTPLLQMRDPGEKKTKGALLVAPYGKGHFVYTGISFFRQLPAGVSGAYRLFANLLSL